MTPSFQPPHPVVCHRVRHVVHTLLLLLSLQCLFFTQFYLYYGGTSRGRQWFRDVSSLILSVWKRGNDDEEEKEGDANAAQQAAALVILGTLALPVGIVGGMSVLWLTSRRRRRIGKEKERQSERDDEDGDEAWMAKVPPSEPTRNQYPSSQERNSPRRRIQRQITSLFRRPSRFAAAFVLLPCLVFFACNVQRHVSSSRHRTTAEESRLLLTHLANDLGILALLSFSHLLLPVSRHSPLVRLLRWSPVEAAVVHQRAGYLAILATGGHGALHVAGAWWRWIDRGAYEEAGGVRRSWFGFWRGYLPPRSCFTRAAAEEGDFLDPVAFGHACPREDGRCVCYDVLVNWTGLLGLMALMVLLVSSVEYVRRRHYRFFYVMHISMAPLFLLLFTLHYHRTVLYLSPSLLYYAATALPARLRAQRQSRRHPRGTRILSVATVPCPTPGRPDGAVLDVVFAASPRAVEDHRPGQYCTVRVPSLSIQSHPFTVATVPKRDDRLRILIKTVGPFTTHLARLFDEAIPDRQDGEEREFKVNVDVDVESPIPPPSLIVEGFHGPPHRWHRHDVVVLAAGGIGITPFLSLLVEAASMHRRAGSSHRTEAVELHWTCRDMGLIRHVADHYVSYLLGDNAGNGGAKDRFSVRVAVTIHYTGPTHYLADSSLPPTTVYDFKSSSSNLDDDTSPMTPSSFSVGDRTEISQNILHFVTFASIFFLGLSSLWYFATRTPSKNDMIGRLWPLIAVILLSLAISFLADAWIAFRSRRDKITNSDSNDDARPFLSDDTYGSFAPSPRKFVPLTSMDATASRTHGNVTYRFRQGSRPLPGEVVSSLKGARNPALFVCGPRGLVKSLREEVERGKKWEGEDCEIYEEVFEM